MGRTKKVWNFTCKEYPQGVLRPNKLNPFYHQTPDERWEGIISACANIVFRVTQERARKELARQGRATATL